MRTHRNVLYTRYLVRLLDGAHRGATTTFTWRHDTPEGKRAAKEIGLPKNTTEAWGLIFKGLVTIRNVNGLEFQNITEIQKP